MSVRSGRPDRISDIYHAVLAEPPEKRGEFLNQACNGDEALRQEVESLLRYGPMRRSSSRHRQRSSQATLLGRQKEGR